MAFTIEDFVNDEVLNATNPHPDYGYFHGKQQPKGGYLYTNDMQARSLTIIKNGILLVRSLRRLMQMPRMTLKSSQV